MCSAAFAIAFHSGIRDKKTLCDTGNIPLEMKAASVLLTIISLTRYAQRHGKLVNR